MLKLTAVSLKDWLIYRQWINDPKIARLIDRSRPVTLTEHKNFYGKIKSDKTRKYFSVQEKDSRKFCGIVSLKNIDLRNKKAEFYICLGAPGVRGKGFGVEATCLMLIYAFERLKLNRIYLYTPAYNKPAIRCYKKVGFVVEGKGIEDICRTGKFYDSIRMCYLKKFYKTRFGKKRSS